MRVICRRHAEIGKTDILIIGEKYSEYWGNTTFKELVDNEPNTAGETIDLLRKHVKYLHEPTICLGIGTLPKPDSSYLPTVWLELPLAEDGIKAAHFLNAVLPVYHHR